MFEMGIILTSEVELGSTKRSNTSNNLNIPQHIFKAYDIRGKYPSELDERAAERIGYATAEHITKKLHKKRGKFFVCRDVRISSKPLRDALVKGIIAQGSDVVDAGVGTSPFFVFLMHQKRADGGIMITASHNPPEYNGLKIREHSGKSVYLGTGLEKIRARTLGKKKESGVVFGNVVSDESYRKKYVDFLAKNFDIKKPLRVVIDAAGGSVPLFLPGILSHFPAINYTPLFFDIDGSFKKHSPNPLEPRAQTHVQKELQKARYNFGVLFDGDGDRVFFFDERGQLIDPQFVFLPLALEMLKKKEGLIFPLPVDTSRAVREEIVKHGGTVKLSRRGYVFLQTQMRKFSSPMSVERSGHYFFEGFSYDDSGIFAFLAFAEFMSKTNISVSKTIKPYMRFASTGELNFDVHDKKGAIARIKNWYAKNKSARIRSIDGVNVEFPDWWFNIRASNTEPVVRLVIEADSEEILREKRAEIEKLLR